ncbi:hypothetical protein ACN6LL_000200, partial [Streptomyces violaceoruber]
GVQIGSPSPTSNFPDAFTNVVMTDNVMRGALRAGLLITKKNVNVTLRNNTIDGPARQGIWVTSGVTGTGTFSGNEVQNLLPGQTELQNDSSGTFKITE